MPSNHYTSSRFTEESYVATLLKGNPRGVCLGLQLGSQPGPVLAPFWSRCGSILVCSLHLTSTRASRVGWPSTNDWIDGHWGASPQLLIIDCMCLLVVNYMLLVASTYCTKGQLGWVPQVGPQLPQLGPQLPNRRD